MLHNKQEVEVPQIEVTELEGASIPAVYQYNACDKIDNANYSLGMGKVFTQL